MAKRRKPNTAVKKRAYVLVILLLIAGAVFFISNFLNRPRFIRYAAFGIDIPVNYPIHGIDVSRYQSSIDWADVKGMEINKIKIGFGFIKATEGADDRDERFKKNWREIKKAGITRGAYHFFNPEKSGVAQANNFINAVKLDSGDLPPVLDVEQISSTPVNDFQKRLTDWLKTIEAYYHIKPIIYTNAGFYHDYLAEKFDQYPLWVAHYLVKDKPRVNRNWTFWQHNETGHVNGIDACVDFNVFNGDSSAFRKLLVR